MRIAVSSDHAGFELRQHLAKYLEQAGHTVVNLGPETAESVDYPDYGAAVGRIVAAGEVDRGVAVCGSGIGISMAANKIAGVRAANVWDTTSSSLSRQHNDANVVCIGERLVTPSDAEAIVSTFLDTDFEGGRHQRRVDKITALEASD